MEKISILKHPSNDDIPRFSWPDIRGYFCNVSTESVTLDEWFSTLAAWYITWWASKNCPDITPRDYDFLGLRQDSDSSIFLKLRPENCPPHYHFSRWNQETLLSTAWPWGNISLSYNIGRCGHVMVWMTFLWLPHGPLEREKRSLFWHTKGDFRVYLTNWW